MSYYTLDYIIGFFSLCMFPRVLDFGVSCLLSWMNLGYHGIYTEPFVCLVSSSDRLNFDIGQSVREAGRRGLDEWGG